MPAMGRFGFWERTLVFLLSFMIASFLGKRIKAILRHPYDEFEGERTQN